MWRAEMCRAMVKAGRGSALGLRGMASSTDTGKGKHVEVPLPMHGVAGKYAAALFVTAVRQSALEPVKADMEQLAGVAGTETLFSEFMRDPSVPKPARMKACEEIFKETKFHDVSKNFKFVLAENARLGWIRPIYANFCDLLLAHHGDVNALVTTALELTPADLEEVKKALGGYIQKGQNVKITQRVDRSIIGGIMVAIGDKFIDLSIDRKIKQMEKVLAEAI